MVVLNRMCVKELASIVRSISSILEPYGKILLIQTLAHEFWVASIRRIHIGDIGIVGGFTCPEIDSRGAAQSDSTEMTLQCQTLVYQVLLDKRLIGQGVKVGILVISKEEDNIESRALEIAACQWELRVT